MSEKQQLRKAKKTSSSCPRAQVTKKTELLTGGIFPATAVVNTYLRTSENPLEVMKALNARAASILDGDLDEVQSMLIGQAIALQAMFADLACEAKKQSTVSNTQILTQLALKAQAGSRSTLQTLADIKRPRQIAFVQQANVAHNQQINNGQLSTDSPASSMVAPIKLFAKDQVENGS